MTEAIENTEDTKVTMMASMYDPRNEWMQRAETTLNTREFNRARSRDSGFVYRAVQIKKNDFIRVRVHYFATHNQPGKLIRHATTGVHYNFRVGSVDELFFYGVLLSTGESHYRGQPILLFYDNPEEYEKHMHVRLPVELKEAWHARLDKFLLAKRKSTESNSLKTIDFPLNIAVVDKGERQPVSAEKQSMTTSASSAFHVPKRNHSSKTVVKKTREPVV